MSDFHRGRARGTLIVVSLVTALVMVGGLAYQALDAAASHRETARSILEDYTALAAEQFALRASQELEFRVLRPTIQQSAYRYVALGEDDVPSLALLTRAGGRAVEQAIGAAEYVFRFYPASRRVLLGPEADGSEAEWLGALLADHVAEHSDSTPDLRIIHHHADGPPRTVAYFVYRLEGETVGYGMAARPDSLRHVLRRSFAEAPLLPEALTRGVSYDSVLAVRIRHRPTDEVFVSLTPWPTTEDGSSSLARWPFTGGLDEFEVEARLDAAAAETLVIGGLPSSRFPYIAGLSLLTAVLIAGALLQFRRERELDRLRGEFVSNVSHELRTPLAQIRMFAETLLLGRVRSEQERERSLEIIDKEARRLTNLVENVLHFSRTERQSMALETAPLVLEPFLHELVESFRPLAETHDCRIAVSAEPLEITADRDALQQVLLNLLDNAVKYGGPGQAIDVHARLDGQVARISVEDDGPGVPLSARDRIWERFDRLPRTRSSPVAGTGIGLAVVRELIHLHGGSCWVEASEGRGARFVIELPNARSRTAPAAAPTPPAT